MPLKKAEKCDMDENWLKKFLQDAADKELSNIETFPKDIRDKIKSEYDRMNAEREEWLKSKNRHD